MQDSLSMVESWRKVIPGLSMIKLTPHRVSQIRFCALDTVAAAYSTLSRVQSHLSCWHHCIAITVSERENALGQHCGKSIKAMLSLSLSPDLKTHVTSSQHYLKCSFFMCVKRMKKIYPWELHFLYKKLILTTQMPVSISTAVFNVFPAVSFREKSKHSN